MLPPDLSLSSVHYKAQKVYSPLCQHSVVSKLNTALENTLYQGCRSAAKDQHYKSQFEALESEGQVVYRVACSRDGPEGVKRTYAQDLIAQDAKRIWELVDEKKAWVYISGYVWYRSRDHWH